MHEIFDKTAADTGFRALLDESRETIEVMEDGTTQLLIKISRRDGYSYTFILRPGEYLHEIGKMFPKYDPLLARLLEEDNTAMIAKLYPAQVPANGR